MGGARWGDGGGGREGLVVALGGWVNGLSYIGVLGGWEWGGILNCIDVILLVGWRVSHEMTYLHWWWSGTG